MDKQQAGSLYQQALAFHAQGRNAEALELLKQLEEAFPDEKNVLLALIRVLTALDQFQDAWKICIRYGEFFPGPEADEMKANIAEHLVKTGAARSGRKKFILGFTLTQVILAAVAMGLAAAGCALILSGGRYASVSGAWVLTAGLVYAVLVFSERIYDINDFLLETCSWAAWNTAPMAVVVGIANIYPGLQGIAGQMGSSGGFFYRSALFMFLTAPLWALSGFLGSAISVAIYRFIIDFSDDAGKGSLGAFLSGAIVGAIIFFTASAEAQILGLVLGFFLGFIGWWAYMLFGMLNRRIAVSLLQ